MADSIEATHPPRDSAPTWPQRLFRRWWRKQPPNRQDRYATVAPLIAVLLFLAAIVSVFWYLRNEEYARELESVRHDTDITQYQMRLRLIENQEQLLRISRELSTRAIDQTDFMIQAVDFTKSRREITRIFWLDANRLTRAIYISNIAAASATETDNLSTEQVSTTAVNTVASQAEVSAFDHARATLKPTYSDAFFPGNGGPVIQVHVPLIDRGNFAGSVVTEYSIESLLRFLVPAEVSSRHALALIDANDEVLASAGTTKRGQKIKDASYSYSVPILPTGNELRIRGQGYRDSFALIRSTLFWMVSILSAMTVWMLIGTGRHMRRRSQMQAALISEANFRRAMENSMLTGMRAMDLSGRITYVNRAYCDMTGFAESELLGRTPPFPHWPPDRLDENMRLLQQELQGRSPAGGIEVKAMRKDGQQFDARMYVSPLIDAKGQQAGWMTSMTNITEAKRVRDQLSASHERFTTVLEGLDAAVSVFAVPHNELLFANRSYRVWFGPESDGHELMVRPADLAPTSALALEEVSEGFSGLPTQELTDAGSDTREVFVELLQKWFDVRTRYLQWTDGRLALMLIATDVTARHQAEAQAAMQAEKAQVTSRLVTMGEMASSVAHELNQPLTAISNYCNGMVSRVKAGSIKEDDLIAALEKTAKQAQRAGQIIHRIRNFVKRSEPQRQPSSATEIVEDAVELVGIELRRRKVELHVYVAQRLPTLMVDPILIEQVVLNLIKNAAEAIDNAQLTNSRRHIELRVVPRHMPDEGPVIEFSVSDNGPGIKDEVISRLYEAFFSTKPEGLGIGLSLCRTIVESHQGRIRAENLYNGSSVTGCRFSFTIPLDLSRTASPLVARADAPESRNATDNNS
jgi:PAS domain S-box-containing protein